MYKTLVSLMVLFTISMGGLVVIAQTTAPVPGAGAFSSEGSAEYSIHYTVSDVPKLEAKAIAILRAPPDAGGTGTPLTLAEAQARVRVGGRTDVARCIEFVVFDRMKGIVQAHIDAQTIHQEHPVQ